MIAVFTNHDRLFRTLICENTKNFTLFSSFQQVIIFIQTTILENYNRNGAFILNEANREEETILLLHNKFCIRL